MKTIHVLCIKRERKKKKTKFKAKCQDLAPYCISLCPM